MVPPVEESVLKNNPNFAALYTTLTTVLLNPDASTKAEPNAKERNAVREELRKHRLKAAKQHLLTEAISSVVPVEAKPAAARRAKAPTRREQSTDLPESLLDLLLLLPPLLKNSTPLSQESMELLLSNPPFSELPLLLPQLTPLVSSSLQSSAAQLARIASPNTNPSYVHRAVPNIPIHVTNLVSSIATKKAALSEARLASATALVSLLAQHTAVLTHLIRTLEAKHSAIARSVELRATEISLAAQRDAIEAESTLWAMRRDTYTPEIRKALANYTNHLRDAKIRLGESIRTLKSELSAYGVDTGLEGAQGDVADKGKERTMREMARVYRDMGRQIEDARRDLDRLGMA